MTFLLQAAASGAEANLNLMQIGINVIIGVGTIAATVFTVGRRVESITNRQDQQARDHDELRRKVEKIDDEQRDETKAQLKIGGDIEVIKTDIGWIKTVMRESKEQH